MNIKIVTDSCADLPKELIEKYKIEVVPLEVRFNDDIYIDGVNLTSEEFYRLMKKEDELPKTASPSPENFIKAFQGPEEEVIVITVSSKLSGTHNSAAIAMELYEAENKEKKIHLVDSLNASVGQGLIVLKVSEMVEGGAPIADILKYTEEYIKDVQLYFMLDTLENVIKGGRIGRVAGHIANLLSIKLIMKENDGVIDLEEKVRGAKKAFKRLVDIVGEKGTNLENKILGIAHANCYEKALEYKKLIQEKYKFKEIIISKIGATIGTYSGEGGIIVAFL